MPSGLTLQINGQNRSFPELHPQALLSDLIDRLELKGDRIAIELNGELAPRTQWPTLPLSNGDRVEIVHFVGGGAV